MTPTQNLELSSDLPLIRVDDIVVSIGTEIRTPSLVTRQSPEGLSNIVAEEVALAILQTRPLTDTRQIIRGYVLDAMNESRQNSIHPTPLNFASFPRDAPIARVSPITAPGLDNSQEEINTDAREECPVCTLAPVRCVTECGHRFCGLCVRRCQDISTSSHPPDGSLVSCPMCRQGVNTLQPITPADAPFLYQLLPSRVSDFQIIQNIINSTIDRMVE